MPLPAQPQPNKGFPIASFQSEPLQIRKVQAPDADEHASNLTGWKQHYDQVTSGPFHGSLTELHLPKMQVFLEQTSQAVRQSCCVWPDAFWFGVPGGFNFAGEHSKTNARINGSLGKADTVMVRPGNCEFELLTPANYAIYGIVIKRDSLMATASQMDCHIDWAQLERTELLNVTESSRLACKQTLAHLTLPNHADNEGPLTDSAACAEQAMMMALLSMLDVSRVDAVVSNSFVRRRRIVAQAREYVLAYRDRNVTVPELCESLHVSRRTLQYCFEDVAGINPVQYLRIIRLNGARRELRELCPDSRTVRDVAADWGFWHFSQFSSDYRKLFGQSPSESLHRHTRHLTRSLGGRRDFPDAGC